MVLICIVQETYQIHLLCGQTLLTLRSGSYYHVNFLASREGEPNQLFFAEVRASLKGVDDVTLCCPVALSGRTGMPSYLLFCKELV
jgi:hypothetical protein